MLIYPYKKGSKSARALRNSLGAKIIKREGSKLRGNPRKVVLNWGCSALPEEVRKCHVINNPVNVGLASHKIKCFKALAAAGVSVPDFCTTRELALIMLENGSVFCRTVLQGHSGQGIVEAHDEGTLIDAPLYVQYVPKHSEYRVHVFDGKVIEISRKVRDNRVPVEDVNWRVRSHQNGFIYQRENDAIPQEVVRQGSISVPALGLVFGAADVVWNEKRQRAYVLEVNTAPGLSPMGLKAYKKAIEEYRRDI